MRKSLKYFGFLLLTLLVITGCSKKDPKDQLTEAIKKTQKLESAAFKVDVTAEMKAEGKTAGLSGTVSGEMLLGEKNADMHAKVSGKYNMGKEESISMEAYAVTEDGKEVSYTTEDGSKWAKAVAELNTDEYAKSLKEFREKELDLEFKSVKELSSDKKGYTKLEVVIDSKKMTEKMEEAKKEAEKNDTTKGFSSTFDMFKSDKDITLTVYLKNGYVSIIEYDATEMLNDLLKGLYSEDQASKVEVSGKISIELDKINNVSKIEVPEEVKKNAVESKKETADPNNA